MSKVLGGPQARAPDLILRPPCGKSSQRWSSVGSCGSPRDWKKYCFEERKIFHHIVCSILGDRRSNILVHSILVKTILPCGMGTRSRKHVRCNCSVFIEGEPLSREGETKEKSLVELNFAQKKFAGGGEGALDGTRTHLDLDLSVRCASAPSDSLPLDLADGDSCGSCFGPLRLLHAGHAAGPRYVNKNRDTAHDASSVKQSCHAA